MKKANNFQIAKAQPQGVAQLLLNFLPISVWHLVIKVLLMKKSIYEVEDVKWLSVYVKCSLGSTLTYIKFLRILFLHTQK